MDKKRNRACDTEKGGEPEGCTEGDVHPRLVVLGFLEKISNRPPPDEREPRRDGEKGRRAEYLDHPQHPQDPRDIDGANQ